MNILVFILKVAGRFEKIQIIKTLLDSAVMQPDSADCSCSDHNIKTSPILK